MPREAPAPRAADASRKTLATVALAEEPGVRVECGLAAEMGVEHVRVGPDLAAADEVDHPREALSLVDGVGDHPFEPRAEPDRVERRSIRDAVGARVIAVVEHDVVPYQLPCDADLRRRVLRDPKHL